MQISIANFGQLLVLNRRMNPLNTPFFGLVALIGGLILLFSPAQTYAAMGVETFVARSGLAKGAIKFVHYNKRHGWHCLSKSHGHEQKKSCRRAIRHSGDSEESRYGVWRRRFGVGGRPVEN
jgi:hypothetical protein